MTHTYNIEGMTCSGCVAKAKSALLKLGDVMEAQVQLTAPQVVLMRQRSMGQKHYLLFVPYSCLIH